MHVDKILDLTREYIDEPEDEESDYPTSFLMDCINVEHSHVFSVIRRMNEDWFGREYVRTTTSGQYSYYLPMDCLIVRRVELVSSSSVSGASPNYSINETVGSRIVLEPITLNDKDGMEPILTSSGIRTGQGYYLYDEKIVIAPGVELGSSWYLRVFYTPEAPTMHRAKAQGGDTNTITLGDNDLTTTYGDVSLVTNFYQGMRIELISGTGAGQLRRVVSYDGDTQEVTVDEDWSTVPDTSTVYSINSPVPKDFHELFALGAAMRAKGIKTEDDTTIIGDMYSALMQDLKNSTERRISQAPRSVRSVIGERI